jgi:cardiolipin synthase
VIASITDYLDGYLARDLESDIHDRPHARPDRRQAAGRHLPAFAGGRHGPHHRRLVAVGRDHHPVPRNPCFGLREYLADLKVSVPVTRLAKWKTAVQMVAIAVLLAGPRWTRSSLIRPDGIMLLWIAAIITLYTGYDYFRAGLKHHRGRVMTKADLFRLGARAHRQGARKSLEPPAQVSSPCRRPAWLAAGKGEAMGMRCASPKLIRVAIDEEHVDHRRESPARARSRCFRR